MAKTETITCDVCGKQKGAVNHWYLIKKHEVMPVFEVMPWHDSIAENINFGHLCGQECTVKLLSEWMQKGR